MIAHGTLNLRPLEHGFSGTLKLHGVPFPIVGRIFGDTLHISCGRLSGEIRRDGNLRVGELRDGPYPYKIEGEWAEDKDGMVLRCVVGE